MDDQNLCTNCGSMAGCRWLADKVGRFIPERVITAERFRVCRDWVESSVAQRAIREKLQAVIGVGSFRAIQQLPAIAEEEMLAREQEEEELMAGDAPRLDLLLYEGITKSAREEQLRIETDEDGKFIEDEGRPRPRPNYQLRQFVIDAEQHIQLPRSVAMFWSTDQLVDHILKVELEQELIAKDKKSSKQTEPQTSTRETEDMAGEGRRVSVNRTGPKASVRVPTKAAPAEESEGTVARPPRKAGAPAVVGGKGPARAPAKGPKGPSGPNGPAKTGPRTPSKVAEAEAPAEAAAFDLSALETRFDEMKGLIDELRGEVKEAREDTLLAVTLLHDALAQTKGTLQFPIQALDEEENPLWHAWNESGEEEYYTEPVEGSEMLQAVDEEGTPLWEPAKDRLEDPDFILGYAREAKEAAEAADSGE